MKKSKLISFRGDKSIKDKYLKRLEFHASEDEIIKGQYWEDGKGCAIGCTVHSNQHDDYEKELGISWRLAIIEDSLFEKMPNEQAKKFPIQFLKSIPVGVDTDLVFKKYIIWNLADKKEGLIYHIKNQEVVKFLTEIADTYKKSLKEEISLEAWKELARRSQNFYSSAYAAAHESAYAYEYASGSAAAAAHAYEYASAYAAAHESAYAYEYAYACAGAYAYPSAYESLYVYTSASASASAYASAHESVSAASSAEWRKIFDERILRMRDKLLSLLKSAKA